MVPAFRRYLLLSWPYITEEFVKKNTRDVNLSNDEQLRVKAILALN